MFGDFMDVPDILIGQVFTPFVFGFAFYFWPPDGFGQSQKIFKVVQSLSRLSH